MLFEDICAANRLRNTLDSVHGELDRRALLTADVIGVTTTGLARDIATLRKRRAKVVVCEEAAEVLEAHMISALMPGVEHLIQIGDHQQLRPQINNYSLSLETPQGMLYQVDRSQFERLAVGEPGTPPMPIAQLNIQRRMRPQIASLIRDTMYPALQDHPSVSDLPDVVGVRENVFWLDHQHMEDTAGDEGRLKSHSNKWEVSMTKALVRHLIRQGAYKSTDIAVLTPYTGQLQKLRASLGEDFEISLSDKDEEKLAQEGFDLLVDTSVDGNDGKSTASNQPSFQRKQLLDSLRLATVDNFQGEEAQVVIVSLVRSNTSRKVGFLRTKNRINVLLSRAQHGLYLIGNKDTYTNIPMWANVRNQLGAVGAVGTAFNLCCPRHTDTPIQCASPEDFILYSPEGGCNIPCDKRLSALCGETCPKEHCQECGHKADSRVDLLEFKSYKELDLDETPIVVIDCGHFFTAESVDGLVSMIQVYATDEEGRYTGLLKPSDMLSVPCCPDCKRPIRQFATRRFNRIVNMAVMDETAKKFRIQGENGLEGFRHRAAEAEKSLRGSQTVFLKAAQRMAGAETRSNTKMKEKGSTSVTGRYSECRALEDDIAKFCRRMGTEQQPSKKLHDAILKSRERQPLDSLLGQLAINDDNDQTMIPAPDKQIILHGHQLLLSVGMVILQDQVTITKKSPTGSVTRAPFNIPKRVDTLLKGYHGLIQQAIEEKLLRVTVRGIIGYARVMAAAHSSRSLCFAKGSKPEQYVNTARALLDAGVKLCNGSIDTDGSMQAELEDLQGLLRREWYEEVTEEEIRAIKSAMVSGPGGISTHSGHWYKCQNGHVFAIGECGMPMELARCPECASPIGGRSHSLVNGVSRAQEMEG
ncbi:hypothetical protein OQA88_10960 [Cercophora sp. LCS_1]